MTGVLITGATAGIGLELAKKYLDEGYNVAFTSRSEEKACKTKQELTALGKGKVYSLVQDLTDFESAQKIAEFAKENLGNFDILINNVGVWTETPFLDVSQEEFQSHTNNLAGTFFLTQKIAQFWIDANIEGSVVNLGSLWGKQAVGPTPSSAHATIKAGIHQMTRNIAQELGPHKIRVNCISPGVINLDATHLTNIHPLQRLGTPHDVVPTIYFLASKKLSGWTTGTIVDVDAGASCGIPQPQSQLKAKL